MLLVVNRLSALLLMNRYEEAGFRLLAAAAA